MNAWLIASLWVGLALLATRNVSVEELHPHCLAYGEVPEPLALYLEMGIQELVRAPSEIEHTLGRPVTVVRPEG